MIKSQITLSWVQQNILLHGFMCFWVIIHLLRHVDYVPVHMHKPYINFCMCIGRQHFFAMILGCMVIMSGQTSSITSFVVCYLDTQSIDKNVTRKLYFLFLYENPKLMLKLVDKHILFLQL